MDWMLPSIIASLVCTIVLVLVYAYLCILYNLRYMRIWTIGWGLYALGLGFEMAQSYVGQDAGLLQVAQVHASLASTFMLLWGAFAFLDRQVPRFWWWVMGAGIVWAVVAWLLGFGFILMDAPVSVLIGAIFIWCGWAILRAPELDRGGRWVPGLAFMVWGAHIALTPILGALDWFAPWRMMVGAFLEMVVAFGFFMVFFQRAIAERRAAQEKSDAILQTAMDAFWLGNEQGFLLDVNEACCAMYGYSRAEMVGMHLSSLVASATPEEVRQRIANIREAGAARYETHHRRKDGSLMEVEVSANYLPAGGGRVVTFLHDITSRKKAERDLRDSEARFRALFESSPVAVELSRKGVVEYVNPAYLHMLGCAQEDVVGQPVPIQFTSQFINGTPPDMRALEQPDSAPLIFETTWKRKNGERFAALVTSRVVELSGEPIMLTYLADLTDLRRAEAEAIVSQARFQSFFEHSPTGMGILNRDLRYASINPALARLNGRTVEEIVGVPLAEAAPDIAPMLTPVLEAIFEGGETALNLQEHFFSKARGAEVWYLSNFFPQFNAAGEVEAVGVVVIDQTESTQAEAEVRQHIAELEAVNRLTQALRSSSALQTLLPRVLTEVLAAVQAEAGSALLFNPQSRRMEDACGQGWLAPVAKSLAAVQIDSLVQTVSATDLIRLDDLQSAEIIPEEVRRQLPAGWMAVILPLRAQEDLLGVLVASNPVRVGLDDWKAHLLATLAEIAANAIQRAHLTERTERNLHRLAALHEIDSTITGSLNLPLTLELVLAHTVNLLGVDAAAVLRLDPTLQQLEYARTRGFRSRRHERLHFKAGEGLAGRCMLDRRLTSTMPLGAGPTMNGHFDALFPGESFAAGIAVPLISKGQVLGALVVYQRSPLNPNEDWVEFLRTLAGQTALAMDNTTLVEKLQHSNTELTQAYSATIEGWSRAMDLRDHETENHTQRVTDLTLQLAQAMGIPKEQWMTIRHGALLHDIGKVGIPDNILLKEGPLTSDEWVIMRKHPVYAYELLSEIAYLRPALDIPHHHHEKWDGSGYPDGLKGEDIPLAARLFAIVDVWDALRSDRPYRQAWPAQKVIDYLRSQNGSHFDPHVVEVFLRLVSQEI